MFERSFSLKGHAFSLALFEFCDFLIVGIESMRRAKAVVRDPALLDMYTYKIYNTYSDLL